MKLLFVMDPLARLQIAGDSTFAMMLAAQHRRHELWFCEPRHLGLEHDEAVAHAWPVTVRRVPGDHYLLGVQTNLSLGSCDAVFMRKDPPIDRAFLYATLVLERARGKTLLVNDPRGLREANEKLYALNFLEWTPRTLVTAHREMIHDFTRDVGGVTMIKPLDGAGGAGVIQVKTGEKNARAIVDMLTHEGHRLAIVQEFLPSVTAGDKRILLLDGEPLGAILRVPRGDDFRSNIHVGGSVVATELTPREHEMVRAVAPRLRADGLHFVGLDVIGERLTEVNVTSPTGIQELGRFTNSKPSDKVIAWAEAHALPR
jgi:glutathione synthase